MEITTLREEILAGRNFGGRSDSPNQAQFGGIYFGDLEKFSNLAGINFCEWRKKEILAGINFGGLKNLTSFSTWIQNKRD